MPPEELARLQALAAAGDETARKAVEAELARRAAESTRAAAEARAVDAEARATAIETARRQEEEAREAERRAQLPAQEQLQAQIRDLQAKQEADRQANLAAQNALAAQTTAYWLRAHKEQALRVAGGDLVIQMVVDGPTPQAIDESIVAAKNAYAGYHQAIREQFEREQLQRISQTTAVPAPSQNPAYIPPQGAGFPAAGNGLSPYNSPDVMQHMAGVGMGPPTLGGMSGEEAVRSGAYNRQNRGQYLGPAASAPGGMQPPPATYQGPNGPRPQQGGYQAQPFGVQAPQGNQMLHPQQHGFQQAPQYMQPVPPPVMPQAPQQAYYPPQAPPPPQYPPQAQYAPQQGYQAPQQYQYQAPQGPPQVSQFLQPAPAHLQNPQQFSTPPQQFQQPQPQQQFQPQYDMSQMQQAQDALARAKQGHTVSDSRVPMLSHVPGIARQNNQFQQQNGIASAGQAYNERFTPTAPEALVENSKHTAIYLLYSYTTSRTLAE